MESLEKNRVFSSRELETFQNDTIKMLNLAESISESFQKETQQIIELLSKVPPKAGRCSSAAWIETLSGKEFVYPDYEEAKNNTLEWTKRGIEDIPENDRKIAEKLSSIQEKIQTAGQIAEELREMVKPENFCLNNTEYQEKLQNLFGRTKTEKIDNRANQLGQYTGMVFTGDPVNVMNGNFVFEECDLRIRGIPFLSMKRTYNSLNKRKGIFGRGWSSTYEIFVCQEKEEVLKVYLADGNSEIFKKEGGIYRNIKAKANSKLILKERKYYYLSPNISVRFNEQGKAEHIENGYGRGIDLLYGERGELLQVIGENERKFFFEYKSGKLSSMRDDTGRRIQYDYEGKKLSCVTGPENRKRLYYYGESNRIEKISNAKGNIILHNVYDEKYRVKWQNFPDGGRIAYHYDDTRGFTQVQYQDGHVTRYRYNKSGNIQITDEQNREKEEFLSCKREDIWESFLKEMSTECDNAGRICKIGKENQFVTVSYGKSNCPENICFSNGAEFQFSYDVCNRVISRKDGRGYEVSYQYDECDHIVMITYPDGASRHFSYDGEGNVIRMVHENGIIYTLSYDTAGKMTSVEDEKGRKVEIPTHMQKREEKETTFRAYKKCKEQYDKAGNLINRSYADGREEKFCYDCRNRLTAYTSPDGGSYEFIYNTLGQCVQKKDPYGNITRFNYDDGKCMGTTDSEGTFFAINKNDEKETTLRNNEEIEEMQPHPNYREELCKDIVNSDVLEERDICGRLIKRTFPGEITSNYTYAKNGRIESICHKKQSEILDSFLYRYDLMGNCIEIICFRKDCPEESGRYRYTYDKKLRLIKVEKDGTVLREYVYDSYGNRILNEDKKKHDEKENSKLQKVEILCRKKDEYRKEYHVIKQGKVYTITVRNLPETIIENGKIYYLLTDHLGSVLRILNRDGKTEEKYSYDEYGISTGKNPEYIGYAGYIPCGEGVYAAGRRYYVPRVGRFLSKDTWRGTIGNPQTFNRYSYAVNNPIRYRDSSGCYPEETCYDLGKTNQNVVDRGKSSILLNHAVIEGISGVGKGSMRGAVYQENYLREIDSIAECLMSGKMNNSDSFIEASASPTTMAAVSMLKIGIGAGNYYPLLSSEMLENFFPEWAEDIAYYFKNKFETVYEMIANVLREFFSVREDTVDVAMSEVTTEESVEEEESTKNLEEESTIEESTAEEREIEDLKSSDDCKKMIKDFELSIGVMKSTGIGAFDEEGNLIGIYPHYVFKKNDKNEWVSDGGITFGYGCYVSENSYVTNQEIKIMVDTYVSEVNFNPDVPANGVSYKVKRASYMPIEEADKLLNKRIEEAEMAVNDFLEVNKIQLTQNQFDALVSFTYQYGIAWWRPDLLKKLPQFIKEGKGVYDPDEVREIFLKHDNKERRKIEAEVFINGYQ